MVYNAYNDIRLRTQFNFIPKMFTIDIAHVV